MNALMEKFMAGASKIGNSRHLLAIRDTLVGMIAITMIGSFMVLINNLGGIIKPWGTMMEAIFGPNWTTLGGDIYFGTMTFLGVFAVFGIAYKLANSYGDDGFEAMFVAAACFFLLLPQLAHIEGLKNPVGGFIATSYFGATALFTGIIVSILATEVFVRLARIKKLVINLPAGVPPAVARSFQKLIPGMVTIFIFGLLGLLFRLASNGKYFNDWLNSVLVSPLSNAADSLPFAILVVLLVHVFWSVGLHGPNILGGITTPLFTKLGLENIDLYNTQVTDINQYHVFAGSFLDAFVYLGGSGATIGLIIAMFIAGRRRHKQLLSLATPPGIFQINEPILFGLPIVLNPIWLIPFILAPVITTITSYLAISWGLVFPVVANIPWVSPPIVGGWLATGGHLSGAILATFNILIDIAIYLPFVYAHGQIEKKRLKAFASDTKAS